MEDILKTTDTLLFYKERKKNHCMLPALTSSYTTAVGFEDLICIKYNENNLEGCGGHLVVFSKLIFS